MKRKIKLFLRNKIDFILLVLIHIIVFFIWLVFFFPALGVVIYKSNSIEEIKTKMKEYAKILIEY